MPPTPVPTAVPGSQSPIAAHFDASSGEAFLLYGLVALAAIVVLMPYLLRVRDKTFFHIPFITWFLLHYGVAALAILAIMILGIAGVINGEVISALFGSLLGYVLGAAGARAATASAADGRAGPTGTITDLLPTSGPAAGGATPVAIQGTGFGATAGAVQFGNVQAEVVPPWTDTLLTVKVPTTVTPGPTTIYVTPHASTTRIASPKLFNVA